MIRLNTTRSFALVAGVLLFLSGLFGFAFRGTTQIPDYLLLLHIVFGFWGILVGIGGK